MNEANILIYFSTLMASLFLALHGFKRRFLPLARPIIGFACLWAVSSTSGLFELLSLEKNQWVSQFLLDTNLVLLTFVFPLWIWMIIEFHFEVKIKLTDKRMLIFYVPPFLIWTLLGIDIISNGFLSQESSLILITRDERMGEYSAVRGIYAFIMIVCLVLLTPYLILKKHKHSLWSLIQSLIFMMLPPIFYALYNLEIIQLRLAPSASILYLFWISSQYRLLDIMPVALQSMVDRVGSAILVADRESKLLYANNYATDLLDLQLSQDDLQRHKYSIPSTVEQYFDFSKPKEQVAKITINLEKEQRKTYYFDAVLQPIYDPKTKKHLGATVSLHDVTERQKTELALHSLDRQKAKFFAGISHEFRTPLTLSLGNLDDALAHFPDKELQETLSQVKSNNKRLLNLVNQLLELSQIDGGSLSIQPTLLHLDVYLPPLIANFESLARKQNIHIHFQIDHQAAANLAVYFDETSFDKIMLNLISNALKSITNGGDVYIVLKAVNDDYIELRVRDTGCGIPAEALSNVFEMFYCHQSENTAWPQGTGVGLSLVKQLVNQHGADIDLSSIEGQGSTFTLSLRKGYRHFPKEVLIQHEVTSSYQTNSNNDFYKELENDLENITTNNTDALKSFEHNAPYEVSEKRVLLVEDNADMRLYIRKHLTKNFQLIEAANGEEALEIALQTTPDLVLSDVMMPKMNGYDLCKQLKANTQTSHIPILLLTAKSSQAEKLEGLELGADDYLSKPFDVKELTLRIKNLIAARQVIQKFYQSHGLQGVICNPELPKREASFLHKLQQYVQKNISNPDIKVFDLAEAVHMSESSLSRKLKVLTGDTPKKMLLVIRLEYAKQLLTSTNESMTEISYSIGFSDSSHFSRSFKMHYSYTPTAYRKQQEVSTDYG